MTAKHTPGPWCALAGPPSHIRIVADGYALIAAAPELLEALNSAPPCPGTPGHFPINSRDLHDWFTRYWNWQKQREAAIAKARGRTC